MKRRLLFITMLVCLALRSAATTYTINVADFSFTPNAINNVHPGDVITWVWQSGAMAHTTTSTTIPSGATSWNAQLDNIHTTFSYTVPNVLGTYSYICSIHPTLMSGSFTVVSSTQVTTIPGNAAISCLPNPSSGKLHLTFSNPAALTSVGLCDLTGKELFNIQCNAKETDIDVSALPGGLYFLRSKDVDGTLSTLRVEIQH
jgi:plastocyanin